jgi:hypothetical protein
MIQHKKLSLILKTYLKPPSMSSFSIVGQQNRARAFVFFIFLKIDHPVVRDFSEIRLSVFEDDKIAICGNRPSARNSPDVHI